MLHVYKGIHWRPLVCVPQTQYTAGPGLICILGMIRCLHAICPLLFCWLGNLSLTVVYTLLALIFASAQAGACIWQHKAPEAAQGEGSSPGEPLLCQASQIAIGTW